MESIKRLLEIKEKGPESVTPEDIPLALGITCQFINSNPAAKELVNDDMSMIIEIKGADKYYLTIIDGKCEFGKGGLDSANFTLTTDLITITKMLLGQIDATVAYFSGDFEAEGELYYMIRYLEILDLAFKMLDIISSEERVVVLKTEDMKNLFDVYARGASTVDPSHITLFFKVFATFVNYNPEAQDLISGEDLKIQMSIINHGDYLIRIVDSKMSWSEETISDFTVKLEMALETSAEILLDGDAVSAFMAGKIKVMGELAKALFFQELNELFLEYLNLL